MSREVDVLPVGAGGGHTYRLSRRDNKTRGEGRAATSFTRHAQRRAGECHVVARTTKQDKVRELQRTLYRAAKADPGRRFHALYGAACNRVDPAGESHVLGDVRCAQAVISGALGGRPSRVKARKYKSRRPGRLAEVGWSRGRATLGAAASSERCSVVSVGHQELPCSGSAQCQLWFWERRARHRGAKASVCGEGIGRVHPQGSPAYGRWHRAKDRWRKAGKVSSPAKTRPHGEDPAYNRRTGSRREAWRLAAEAVVARTARTTQPRPSEGPLGERGRHRWKGLA
jgi:hypothetical protein